MWRVGKIGGEEGEFFFSADTMMSIYFLVCVFICVDAKR